MKVHSYTYRGKLVDVYEATIDDITNFRGNKNYLEYTDKGITTRVYIKSFSSNDQSYTLSVNCFFKELVKSLDGEGAEIETETFSSDEIRHSVLGKYLQFYSSEVTGMMGGFIRRAEINALVEVKNYKTGKLFIGESAYPNNPLTNSWMQPLSYDLTTTETGVTVVIIDTKVEYNLEYSLDGGKTYDNLIETEIPLTVGSYTILIRAKEELYPFAESFSIVEPFVEL